MTLTTYDGHHIGHGLGREEPIVIADDKTFNKDFFLIPHHYQKDISKILIPRGLIRDRVEKLACDILRAYAPGEPLHLICVLKGSRGFFTELTSVLNRIYRYSEDHKEPPFVEYYVRLKKDLVHKGHIHAVSDDLSPLQGKQVLIVEDMVDSGATLSRFSRQVLDLKPKSLRTVTLLEKRKVEGKPAFKADFAGFSVPDVFVAGYCIDLRERYRDLDHIAVLTDEAIHSH